VLFAGPLCGIFIASPFLVSGHRQTVAVAFGTVSTVSQAMPYAICGAVIIPLLPYLLTLAAGAHAATARVLLDAPSEQLRTELIEVARSRARLVDAFDAERRRIERDLHDGAQQRLVSLTLQLGLARLDLPPDSPAATALADAHEQAKALMAELRDLIQGIRPQVLTDLGLAPAVRELADQSPVPVTVTSTVPSRLPGPARSRRPGTSRRPRQLPEEICHRTVT
jgi:signal transduction histidine kinase